MNTEQQPPFGRLRSIFWPVYRHELRVLIPMFLMMFLTGFNYTILRNMKDSIVITSQAAGAEVIPFIKVWAMLPMAVLITYIFAKLSNRFSQERVYYIMLGAFISFYAFFAFFLYPNRDYLHLDNFAKDMVGVLPQGFRGLVGMLQNWTFTAFYVMSEMWASIVYAVLFWGFANEITKVSAARRFYGILAVGTNASAIVAGRCAIYFSSAVYDPSLPYGNDAWEQCMVTMLSVVILVGLGIMATFWWMNRYVLTSPEYEELHLSKREFKLKKRLSMRESLSFLSKSKYLLCIATLVVSYNLVINLVEVIWKDQVRILHPDPSEYNIYLNNLTMITGVISTMMSFFLSSIIGGMGWTRTALITPLIMLVTSAGFFFFFIFSAQTADMVMAFTGMTPLAIAVLFGGAQNSMSKSMKYSVFDGTKEMAFIPLDHEWKLKGKAVIDGVGSRFGKSGGSFIHQGLLMILGSFAAAAPIIAVILLGAILFWMVSIRVLGREFAALVVQKQGAVHGVTDDLEEPKPAEPTPALAR